MILYNKNNLNIQVFYFGLKWHICFGLLPPLTDSGPCQISKREFSLKIVNNFELHTTTFESSKVNDRVLNKKWQWLLLLGAESLAPKFNFFSLSVLSETFGKENFNKNGIILILKSILRRLVYILKNKAHLLKQSIFVSTEHKTTQKTYLFEIFLKFLML